MIHRALLCYFLHIYKK